MISVLGGDYTGYRSTTNGLAATDKYGASFGGLSVSWDIKLDQSGGFFTYTYTFSRLNGGALTPRISHALLELSPTITQQNIQALIANPNFTISLDSPRNWTSQQGNPNLPGTLYGMKMLPSSDGQLVFTFDSPQFPVWGDIFVKGGRNSTIWNIGFGTEPTQFTTIFTPWIPVPDTQTVPEPSSAMLAITGALGLVLAMRRRRTPPVAG
jgi:hypothetical protein